jgi:hypothetical protein
MIKKHFILLGIMMALLLMLLAACHYPGGSPWDKNAIGYDWKNNYLCNLFNEKAVNGLGNTARPWAVAGMLVLSVSFALFFAGFSKKIASRGAAKVIRYAGMSAMFFAFLIVTPLHDPMVTLSGTLALISIFYITVFIFKSKLYFFKLLSVICMLVFYCCNYIYYSGTYLHYLPVMQKLMLAVIIIWIVGLQYFTKKEDFQQIKTGQPTRSSEETPR